MEPSGKEYIVQVASLSSVESANALVRTLTNSGFRAYHTEVDIGTGERVQRVYVGRYGSRAQAELASTLWNYYRPKLPNAAELIVGMLNQLHLTGPWNSAAGLAQEPEALAAAAPGEGLWTPDAPAAGGETSKLWLPGQ